MFSASPPVTLPLDDPTLQRYLSSPFRYLGEGCRCRCYATPEFVLKILKTAPEVLKSFRQAGVDLAGAPWSPVPGDALQASEVFAERARASANRALEELADEARLVAGRFTDLPCRWEVQLEESGKTTRLGINGVYWALQHRAIPLGLALERLEKGPSRTTLTAMLDFVETLWAKEVTDETAYFLSSYGIFGRSVGLIDICELRFGPEEVESERARRRMLKGHSMDALRSHRPELAEYLESEFEARFGQ
jgi:hypothetical protein